MYIYILVTYVSLEREDGFVIFLNFILKHQLVAFLCWNLNLQTDPEQGPRFALCIICTY